MRKTTQRPITPTDPEVAAALARLRAELGGRTPKERLQVGLPPTLTEREKAQRAVNLELGQGMSQDRRSDLERLRDRITSGAYDVLDRLASPNAGMGGVYEPNPTPRSAGDFLLNAAGSTVELLNPTMPIRLVAGGVKGIVDTQQAMDTARRRYGIANHAESVGIPAGPLRQAADASYRDALGGLVNTGATVGGLALGGVPGAVAGVLGGPELGTLATKGSAAALKELKNRLLTDPASIALQAAGVAHIPAVRKAGAAVGRGVVSAGRASAMRPALGSGLGGLGEGPIKPGPVESTGQFGQLGKPSIAEKSAMPKPSDHLFADDPAVVGAVDMTPADIAELRGLAQAEDPKVPRKDWVPMLHSFRSPLSITGAGGKTIKPGTYEQIGGEAGKAISDTLRQVQATIGNDARPDVQKALMAQARPILDEQIDALRAGRGTPDNLPRPGLAEAVEAHLRDLERVPKPYEAAYGRTVDALTGGKVEDADGALRRHVDRVLGVGNVLRLKYNVKSALGNLSQPLETLWPYVSTADYARIVADYTRPETRQRLADIGVLEASGKVEGDSQIISPKGKVGATIDKLPATVRDPFGAASSANRGIGYLYGEMEAKRQGIRDPEEVKKSGYAWAERVEFDNSTFNAPPVLRDTLGRFFGQYKGFQVKALENLIGPESITRGDMAPAERLARLAKWGAAKVGPGGLKALGGPVGAGLAVWAYVQAREYAKSLGASEDDAEQAGRLVALGLPTLGGADISGSVGYLEPPFGDTPLDQAVNLLGPTVGMGVAAGKVRQSMDRARAGDREVDWLREAQRFTPYARSVRGGLALKDLLTTGERPEMTYPDGEGHQVTVDASTPEILSQLLGAPTARLDMGFLLRDATPPEVRQENRERDRPAPRRAPTPAQFKARMNRRL